MFKKPNILRRRGKPNSLNTNPKPCVEQIHIVYTTTEETPAIVNSTPVSKHKCSKEKHKSRTPAQRITLDSYMCNEYRERKRQNCTLVEDTNKPPGCKSDVVMMGPEDCPRVQMGRAESVATSLSWRSSGKPHTLSYNTITESVVAEQPAAGAPEWACSQAPCTQTFHSYDSLAEHLLSHNAEELLQNTEEGMSDTMQQDSPARGGGGSSYSCPARLSTEGRRCLQVFCERSQLHTHIKEEHKLDDAPFKCEICGRGFFWCKGLRAHRRSHAGVSGVSCSSAARVHACMWPGCARVFTQACRLREHSRAHTGDKPYPCVFPKCGWSFRTASKLQRHVRGHTGERRHACVECGRGFLRAEHLREHLPRHAPARPPQHCCPHPGCQQKFSNKSSLYGHQKRHAAGDVQANVQTNKQIQLVTPSLMVHIGDILASTSINPECEQDYHAARTHCPYPLRGSGVEAGGETAGMEMEEAESGGETETAEWEPPHHVRMSQLSENTESMDGAEHNEFAVQKDLFLHENPTQHDGRQTAACEESMDGMSAIQLDHHLGLLDSPPDHHITHLLQEELLYHDVNTDETSFQVLLLSEMP